MTGLKKFSLRHTSWLILACLVSTLGFSGCAEMSALMSELNTVESEQNLTEETIAQPTPPPSIQDVEEAISSTKTLLDDQQKQIGNLLSLRGEVKQTLREFRDQNLTPMNTVIETLQHQVGRWEDTSTTNQATLSSTIGKLEQDLEQAQTRVGVYGEQVTALVDQIDQNNRQYEKLLTEFQDSLFGFKGAMGEFQTTLTTEKDRATQEEGALANQLKEQQQTLDQVTLKTNDILVLQKRLNQLHVYINQVRDTVTSDTTALQTALKNEAPDNFQELVTSLEERYQQLAQSPSSTPALTEHLQTLEQRVEQSEKYYAESVKALHDDIQEIHNKYDSIQEISMRMQAGHKTQEAVKLQALVTSLEQRYQQLTQAPSSDPASTQRLQALEERVEKSQKHYSWTVKTLHDDIQKISTQMQEGLKTSEMENLQALVLGLEERYQQLTQAPSTAPASTQRLQALEERVEQSEKHYTETMATLHDDVKDISVWMRTALKNEAPDNLRELVTSLEEQYQQLAQTSFSNPALTEHLQALEQRVKNSEKHHAEKVKALQHEVQTVSARMVQLTQSFSPETVEALHHDIQEVSAGMLKLAQSISYLEKTKTPTTPIHTESRSVPGSEQ